MNAPLGNLDDLISQVRRRAEQHALALEASARAQAADIETESAARARSAADDVASAGRRAAEEARRQRLAVADLERRRRRLEAREARLERVWNEAEAVLARSGDAAAWAALARDAARRLGGDEVVVAFDAAALASLRAEQVAGWAEEGGPALRLDAEPLPHGRGLVARNARASVDGTFEGRLRQARERLRSEVDALLTGRAPKGAP